MRTSLDLSLFDPNLLDVNTLSSHSNQNSRSSSHYNQMYTPPLETVTRDIDHASVYNAYKVCFYCGNHIDPDDKFCDSCGKANK